MVRFPAEVDLGCADNLRERLLVLLNRGTGMLVADLRTTTFCDCAGLNVILRARTRAEALRTPFGLLLPGTGPVWKVFLLSGATEIIPHAGSLEELIEVAWPVRSRIAGGPKRERTEETHAHQ